MSDYEDDLPPFDTGTFLRELRAEEAENERRYFEQNPELKPSAQLVAELKAHNCPTATSGECYCPTPGDNSGDFQPCGHLQREDCSKGCED